MKKSNKNNRPWTAFYGNVPANLKYPNISIVDLINETSLKYPNNIAYDYFGSKCTYKELMQKIETVARALKAYGIQKGEKVTICMPNTPEGIISFYAVNMVGAIANMIHPLSSEKEMEMHLNTTKSKFVICIDVAFLKIYNIMKYTKVERLVVKLLLKMGYGSGIEGAGMVTQASNDGGIDGIIKEDQLGFSHIYIQAKQWALEQTVGKPEIQKFVGALQGQQAQTGHQRFKKCSSLGR